MDPIDSLLEKPRAYYNVDGVGELSTGFMILAFALLQWMQVHSPQKSGWNGPVTLYAFMGVVCAMLHYGSKAIKKHITYPRTGFVEYQTVDTIRRPLIVATVVSTLAAIGLFIALRSHWDLTTPFSLVGLIFAASYARGFARTIRWKWAVVWVMVLGSLLIATLPADLVGALAKDSWVTRMFPAKAIGACWLSFMLYGTTTTVSGGISLLHYLRATRTNMEAPYESD